MRLLLTSQNQFPLKKPSGAKPAPQQKCKTIAFYHPIVPTFMVVWYEKRNLVEGVDLDSRNGKGQWPSTDTSALKRGPVCSRGRGSRFKEQ